MKPASKRPNPTIKALAIAVLSVLVLGLGFFVFALLYTGDKKPIESVADQLNSGPDWRLATSSTVPPRIVCLGDNPCPSVHRAWTTGDIVTRTEFEQLLSVSGWNDFAIEGDCVPQRNVLDQMTVCRATGVRNGFDIEVVIGGNYYDQRDNKVSLFIRRH